MGIRRGGDGGIRVGVIRRSSVVWSPAQQLSSVGRRLLVFGLESEFFQLLAKGLKLETEGVDSLVRLLLFGGVEFGFGEVGVGVECS